MDQPILQTIAVSLSQQPDFNIFSEICDEARRRQIVASLNKNGFSFQKSGKELGYSNGGLYGSFKLLFNAPHLGAGKKDIKDFIQKLPINPPPHEQEDIIQALATIPNRGLLNEVISKAENMMFSQALKNHGFNRLKTAHTLGVSGRTITDKVRKHNIFVPDPDYGRPSEISENFKQKDLEDISRTFSLYCKNVEEIAPYLDEACRHLIVSALEQNKFVLTNSSLSLGIDRRTLGRLCERLFNIDHFNAETLKDDIEKSDSHSNQAPIAVSFILSKSNTIPQIEQIRHGAEEIFAGHPLLQAYPPKKSKNNAPEQRKKPVDLTAEFMKNRFSYRDLTSFKRDMITALFAKAIIQNDFNLENAAGQLEVEPQIFLTVCNNYFGEHAMKSDSNLRERINSWKPKTSNNGMIVNDHIPNITTYSELKELFTKATKLILEEEWNKLGRNNAKTAHTIGIQESDLTRQLKFYGITS